MGLLEPFLTSGFVLQSQATGDYIDRLDSNALIRSSPSEQSFLRFEKIGDFRVHIKADNGNYLSINGANWLRADRETPDDYSIFRVYNNDGMLSIKAITGKYVTAC